MRIIKLLEELIKLIDNEKMSNEETFLLKRYFYTNILLSAFILVLRSPELLSTDDWEKIKSSTLSHLEIFSNIECHGYFHNLLEILNDNTKKKFVYEIVIRSMSLMNKKGIKSIYYPKSMKELFFLELKNTLKKYFC